MPKLTLSFKGQSLSVHHLEEGRTLIGRDPACDIVIDSLAVALQHLEVSTVAELCRVRGLDKASPVLVNNKTIEEAQLNHGDLLQIGKHTLTFADDGYAVVVDADSKTGAEHGRSQENSSQTEVQPSTAYIQILSGDNIGRIIPLNRNMIRLGKAGGDCAIIVHRAGGYYLSNLEGGVPTVDGVPIGNESVELTAGNTIRIGGTELQFYV